MDPIPTAVLTWKHLYSLSRNHTVGKKGPMAQKGYGPRMRWDVFRAA